MKILLIRPRPHKETIGLQHVMICEPLELEYLISNIPNDIRKETEVEIVDMILEKRSFEENSIIDTLSDNLKTIGVAVGGVIAGVIGTVIFSSKNKA